MTEHDLREGVDADRRGTLSRRSFVCERAAPGAVRNDGRAPAAPFDCDLPAIEDWHRAA